MKVTQFLQPSAVVDLQGASATEVLAELCQPLAAASVIAATGMVRVLQAREALGSTGIGEGCAIPHGRVPGLPNLVASFGRSRAGIDFHALDGKPVRLFFALVAPESAPGPYLAALAAVSQLFRNPAMRESLLAAPDCAAIYRLLEAGSAG
ncbi:MAG TPA: PTS sugar transporter subunit IIA [Anaeromyxobacteraceae bacterium]|nr:PTS sugar transporter subunit IIA [Anaeromyxobacteraceae bacterium]